MGNKKRLWLPLALLVAVCAASVLFGACGGKSGDPATYTLTFAGGQGATGTAPAAIVGEAGASVTLPENTFAKEGAVFARWSDGAAEYAAGASYLIPARDVTLTAVWTPVVQVTVTVKDGETVVDSATLDQGGAYTLPQAPQAPEGKRFAGWMVGAEVKAAGAAVTVNADLTITAQWIDVFALTFTAGAADASGDVPQTTQKAAGETVTMPLATGLARLHYTFAGWQPYTVTVAQHPITGAEIETETKDGETLQPGDVYSMTAAATRIKATWTANTVTIRFAGGQGATGTMADEQKQFGKSYFVPTTCGFTNGDKTFLGWTLNGADLIDGALPLNAANVSDDDLVTLTAVWADPLATLDELAGVYRTADGIEMLVAADGKMIFDGKLLLTMDNSLGFWLAADNANEFAFGAPADGALTVGFYNYDTEASAEYAFTRAGDVADSTVSVAGGYLRTQGPGITDVPMKLFDDGTGLWMLNSQKNEATAIRYSRYGEYVVVYNGAYFYVMTRTDAGLAGWYNNGAVQPVFRAATVRTLIMTAGAQSRTQLVADGAKAVAWTPAAPEGQTLLKWVVKDTETEFRFDTPIGADTEIVARFGAPAQTYGVKTASGNRAATGTAPVLDDAAEGEAIVLPANPYALTHYTFAGWQPCTYVTDGAIETDTEYGAVLQPGETFTMIAQPVKFKATWTANTVTIRFAGGQGATGTMADEQKQFGKSYFVPTTCGFTNGDKTFLGWTLNGADLIDGALPLNAANVSDDDLVTLTAVWADPVTAPTLAELAGNWTGTGGTLALDGAKSAAVLNGDSYLSLTLAEGVWYAYNYDLGVEYALAYADRTLTLTSAYDGTQLVFTASAALTAADEASFAGRYAREINGVAGKSIQPLMVQPGGKGYLGNSVTVAYEVIGDYLVVKQLLGSSGGIDSYQYFILTRETAALTGWFLQSEKAPLAVSFAVSADVFVLSVNGAFNQLVLSGKAPLADKIVVPAAPDGQAFDRWVLAGTTTAFDVTAVITADTAIEATFTATAAAKIFEGSYSFSALKRLVRISINQETMAVIYTTANQAGKETISEPETATIVNGAYRVSINGETFFLKISADGQTLDLYDYETMDPEDHRAAFTLAA